MIKTIPLFIVLFLWPFTIYASDVDDQLRSAIEKGNRGQIQEAIKDLRALKSQAPQDSRVRLSLGLMYQTAGFLDEAISELEGATFLSPTSEGYYALGLLYEAKLEKEGAPFWHDKAVHAWKSFLNVVPKQHPLHSVGKKHLERLVNKSDE